MPRDLILLGFAATGAVLLALGHEEAGLLLIGLAVPTGRRGGGSA